jgi:hypothetical protein
VGILGQGASGCSSGGQGFGGSGGANGACGNGGYYGGGGASFRKLGGIGAVRIVWNGCNRSFPSTCVGSP